MRWVPLFKAIDQNNLLKIHWVFHDALFSKIDWMQEILLFPPQTLVEQLGVRHCLNTKAIRSTLTILDPTTASRMDRIFSTMREGPGVGAGTQPCTHWGRAPNSVCGGVAEKASESEVQTMQKRRGLHGADRRVSRVWREPGPCGSPRLFVQCDCHWGSEGGMVRGGSRE